MPTEIRSRITLLLPAPTTLDQHYRVDSVLTSLIEICGGVTVSSDIPPAFTGSWIGRDGHKRDDTNLVIFADAPVNPKDPSLIAYLERLKLRCQQDFAQDLVWVTIHEVERITTHDP